MSHEATGADGVRQEGREETKRSLSPVPTLPPGLPVPCGASFTWRPRDLKQNWFSWAPSSPLSLRPCHPVGPQLTFLTSAAITSKISFPANTGPALSLQVRALLYSPGCPWLGKRARRVGSTPRRFVWCRVSLGAAAGCWDPLCSLKPCSSNRCPDDAGAG